MSTFRLLHTSDVHLDTSFSGSGFSTSQGQALRAHIRRTFLGIIELALKEDVQALLIAGDLYEADRVTPDTVKFLDSQFRRLGERPVVIAPGNHDPCTPTSPYRQHDWPANVRIFHSDEPACFDLGLAQVHGLAHLHADERRNLMQRLRAASGPALQLALLHASDTRFDFAAKQRYAPFHPDDLAGRGFHYIALGHYHRCYRVDAPLGGGTALLGVAAVDAAQSMSAAWYCGCPQARGFDEPEDCSCLLVTLHDEGSAPRVEVRQQPTGGKRFLSGELDCTSHDHSAALIAAIRAWIMERQAGDDAVRLRLTGEQSPTLRLELHGILEQCRDAAFALKLVNTLRPAYDLEALAEEDSLRGAFVRTLRERLAGAEDEERPLIERALQFGLDAFADRELVIP
ncbi:MAG: DNA repair exonuclease [Candidatus Tectomicrobia bacterium]|nr:DNA repair exonuclease [Candidatus Tectomicrobia bacterium]